MEKDMNFGQAIEALKSGERVAREGWNGKGMWLSLVRRGDWEPNDCTYIDEYIVTAPFIAMKTADDNYVPWLASQTDMLAEDWAVVE